MNTSTSNAMTLVFCMILVCSLHITSCSHGSSSRSCTPCSTTCRVKKTGVPPYNGDHLGIGANMDETCLPNGQVIPENDYICYKHNWCKNTDGCKLVERAKDSSCHWNLMTVDDSIPSHPNVQLESPKHSCETNNRYFNKLFCVYNVSLPACANTNTSSGGVRITFNEDDVDIPDNSPCKDYVQIVHSNGKFEKLCGDYSDLEDNQRQYELSSTNFLVTFFSDKTAKAEGFSLRAECRT